MIKLFELQNSNSYTQFTSQPEKDDSFNYKHQKTASISPLNLINVENKLLSPNKNNYKKDSKSMISNYNNNNKISETSKNVKLKKRQSLALNPNRMSGKINNFKYNPINDNINKFKRKASLMPNIHIHNISNNSDLINSMNLISFLGLNQSKKANDIPFLPNITENIEESIKPDKSYKIKGNKKNQIGSRHNDNTRKKTDISFISGKSIKKLDKKDNILNSYAPYRKFNRMKTVLNIHKNIDNMFGDNNSKKDNNIHIEKKGKGLQNQELLYSQKFNNYVVRIYKTNENKKNFIKTNLEKKNKYKKLKKKYSNKSPKFTIKEYLKSFDPKKYIKKIKNKEFEINIGDSKEMKAQLLDKTNIYIENLIFKKNKIKKRDALELIKEKNCHLIKRYRKKLIQKIINEILLKKNIKYHKIIFNLFMDNLKIIINIRFHIYITLSIIKHVITSSEKDENLYFINLIKTVLYSGNKKISKKFPFFKKFEFFIRPIIKKITSYNRFVESNNKKIFFLFFTLKFQLIDCETILQSYDEKEYKILTKKTTQLLSASNIDNKKEEEEKESENFSTIENRIRKKRRTQRSIKLKLSFSSKLMNINLTKSIIKLRGTKFDNELKKQNNFKINMLNEYKSKIIDLSDSSDSDENNKFVKKIKNNIRTSNNNANKINNKIIDSKGSIEEDNKEIHLRDRKLLYDNFISCIECLDYDKLYNWLKKSERYIDLNYKFDNGDTLLHLCVRHSVPQFLVEYLLYHGININSQNNQGDTALHLACKNHRYKTINLLIKMGASEYIYNKMQKNCWECL